eukprot:CAMPEP_0184699662 /NCGR_PEP_ID=MMETSP0313-20130426/5853_1 /TAXON_ID=2792 /ORGANISM="Porphyridium aerugineum, Strain SAG 1380-2" /LENGTH=510 /DNA_ID=CAMNT_0027158781 /DNA_START=56 /DNA_END=1588 /DNA_ORIENTATION=-
MKEKRKRTDGGSAKPAVSGSAKQRTSTKMHEQGLEEDILDLQDTERFTAMHAERKKKRKSKAAEAESIGDVIDVEDEPAMDDKTARRILTQARGQREEVELEDRLDSLLGKKSQLPPTGVNQGGHAFDDEDQDDDENGDDLDDPIDEDSEGDEFEYLDVSNVHDDDEAALALFNQALYPDEATKQPRMSLAEMIVAKIEEHDRMRQDAAAKAVKTLGGQEVLTTGGAASEELDPRVISMFTEVGELMAKYRSGRIPKAFKIIPTLQRWEDVMWITRPDQWSPHSVLYATRLFTSNLKPADAQHYMSQVLLPRVREDIAANKKLNVHLYDALKKALFKPQAFFKGILFPLCEPSGGCTLREATIIGSVLSRVSVPMLHSAAALLRIAEMRYTGANSLFIRVLLDKKYALPYKVIDALVNHFCSMKVDRDKLNPDTLGLPVLWHQTLLTFAQRYKTEITEEQKQQLKVLIRTQTHYQITPEIRRELFSSRARGEHMDPSAEIIARRILDASS